jgi:membrane protein implicated in regulation of membrane protease activity
MTPTPVGTILILFLVLTPTVALFWPLLRGIWRAAKLMVSPRKSLEARSAEMRASSVAEIYRMAREVEARQPNLAAELRSLAGR